MRSRTKLLVGFVIFFLVLVFTFFYFFKSPTIELSFLEIKSNILNSFSQITINPLITEYNGNYKIKIKTGNESFYDVTFEKINVSIGKEIREDTIICLEAGWDEKKVITYKDMEEKEIDKNYTYFVPLSLSFYKTDLLLKQSNLIKTKDSELSATSPSNPNKFCYQANPEKDFYLKFGDNSIIIIQEQDVVGDSLLTNVTAETGASNFTHLNISNTAPYDDLVGYWSFDGDKTNTKLTKHYDFTKENNDGTGGGDAVVNETGCIYDDCLQLDGDGDYVDCGNDQSLNITENLTISMWVNPSEVPGAVRTIIGKGDAQSLQTYQIRHFDVDVVFSNRIDAAEVTSSASSVLAIGKWTHIAVTRTDNGTDINQTLYIDSVQKDSDLTAGNVYSDTNNLFIGKQAYNLNFNGTIDEVMIFNTTLTATQILEIYNNQSARFVKEGLQQLNNQSYLNISSGNNRVNVTTTIENNFNSKVNLSVGYYDGSWGYTAPQTITSGINYTFTISSTSTNLTLNYTLIAGNSTNPFYTPILKGDIILDVYSTAVVDTIFPNVTIHSPTNITYASSSILFNATAIDETEMSSCWVTIDGGVSNLTLYNSTHNDYYNVTNTSVVDGSYLAQFYCNDSSNNINDSESVDFSVDTIFPDINMTHPQNTTYTSIITALNYTASDINLNTCWYSLDLGVTNTTLACGTNVTGLNSGQGSSTWWVWSNDSVNNINSSNVTFFVDSIFPDINITFPINNTNSTNNGLNVNYTLYDLNLNSCWWTSDSGATNTTLASCINITTETWTDGIWNITIYTNDSVNNVNSSSVTFRIDTTPPDIEIVYPPNNTFTTNTGLDVNYTVSDLVIGLDSCWYSNDTYTTNTSIACGTNITTITWTEGNHNVTIWANDTLDNVNSSRITFNIDTIPPTFDNLANQSIYDNESLSYDLDATDTRAGVSKFAINWTSTFSINENTGIVTNTSALSTIRIYYINVSVNDTLGNLASGIFWVNVSNSTAPDTTAPTFDNLINHTHTVNTSFSYDLDATDASGISTFTLNNTDYFNISSTGLIINITNLSRTEIHYFNVTVNDTWDNLASGEFWINVTKAVVTLGLNVYSPINITYDSSELTLNVSASGTSIDKFWYSLNEETNITFIPNITLKNLGWKAYHRLQVWVNDTSGNEETIIRKVYIGKDEDYNDKWLYFYGVCLGLATFLFIYGYKSESYILTLLSGFLVMAFAITFVYQRYPALDNYTMEISIILLSMAIGLYITGSSAIGMIREGI